MISAVPHCGETIFSAGCSFKHKSAIPVVQIADSNPAMTKQTRFIIPIFRNTCVLMRSHMIFSKIGKNTNFKFNSFDPFPLDSLRRYFHDCIFASHFYHFSKILVNGKGFIRCILLRDLHFSDHGPDRAHQRRPMSECLQHLKNQAGNCRFPLGSGHTNSGRILKIRSADISQCFPRVLHKENRHPLRNMQNFFIQHQLLYKNCHGASYACLTDMPVAVIPAPRQTYKQFSLFRLSGIIRDSGNLNLCKRAWGPKHRIFQLSCQIYKLHTKPLF